MEFDSLCFFLSALGRARSIDLKKKRARKNTKISYEFPQNPVNYHFSLLQKSPSSMGAIMNVSQKRRRPRQNKFANRAKVSKYLSSLYVTSSRWIRNALKIFLSPVFNAVVSSVCAVVLRIESNNNSFSSTFLAIATTQDTATRNMG